MPDAGASTRQHESHAAAGIASTRQRQTLPQRHGPSVELQIGAGIVGIKSDNEARTVDTAIAVEGLRRRRR